MDEEGYRWGEAEEGCFRRRCARPEVSFSSLIHRLISLMGTCLFTVLPPSFFCFSSSSSSSFRTFSSSSSSFVRASCSLFASCIAYSGFLIHSFKSGFHWWLQWKFCYQSEFEAHWLRGTLLATRRKLTPRILLPPRPCSDTLASRYCHTHMAPSPRLLHTWSPS